MPNQLSYCDGYSWWCSIFALQSSLCCLSRPFLNFFLTFSACPSLLFPSNSSHLAWHRAQQEVPSLSVFCWVISFLERLVLFAHTCVLTHSLGQKTWAVHWRILSGGSLLFHSQDMLEEWSKPANLMLASLKMYNHPCNMATRVTGL